MYSSPFTKGRVVTTFHQAGVASKSAVTRGVPRLNELLKVTKDPKATSLTIYLRPEHRKNKEKAREVVQDLELTVLRNITEKVAIYWDENDEESVIEEDKELLSFYQMFEAGFMAEGNLKTKWSKWLLRLELNREEMFNRNVSIQEVVMVIKAQLENNVNVVYSDYNSEKLVMRIRIPPTDAKDTASNLDDFTNLKKFQNKLLNNIVIRGLPGIKAVTFRNDKNAVEKVNDKYEKVEQYVLDTDGTNFLTVMNHPYVDGTKLTSSHVHDIYPNLGIEATRATLIHEITTLFEESGVNCRHLGLLCDVMTRAGRLMSADRYGINKMDIGPLAKASFEETEKILLRAALFGEMDPVTGISANIMMGQPIRGGTGFFDVLFDESAFMRLQEGMTPVEGFEDEDEGPTQEQINAELHEDQDDMCSTARLRMNVAMPQRAVLMDEADVEITIMGGEEE